MRYLKAALAALVGGFLLAVAVTGMGGRRCDLGGSCHYVVQTGGRAMLFVLGSVAIFAWFARGRRRLPGL